MSPNHRAIRSSAVLALALSPIFATCDDNRLSGPSQPLGYSKALGVWQPGPGDTCSAAIHEGYAVVGPDGLLYPTWHPPVDPATGCTFGHEHGRDPRGSDLYDAIGPIPFGYANQVLDTFDPLTMRHEDHVGHKIEWENDFRLAFNDGANAVLDIRCDALTKLHQGSHSKDAFTNNLHELVYAIDCTDGTALHITVIAAIGTPGEMIAACDGRVIRAGTATPPNSPRGGGQRRIPDRTCIDRFMLAAPGERSNVGTALHENWEVNQKIRRVDGSALAHFNPYFQVMFPSRFYDASRSNLTGRPVEVCYEVRSDGSRAQSDQCERSTGNGAITGVSFDDPRSVFNGVRRVIDINGNLVVNAGGPQVWYTDPFGNAARTEAFPGAIRQFIARVDNRARAGHGPVIGRGRDYGGPGVHAPN